MWVNLRNEFLSNVLDEFELDRDHFKASIQQLCTVTGWTAGMVIFHLGQLALSGKIAPDPNLNFKDNEKQEIYLRGRAKCQ